MSSDTAQGVSASCIIVMVPRSEVDRARDDNLAISQAKAARLAEALRGIAREDANGRGYFASFALAALALEDDIVYVRNNCAGDEDDRCFYSESDNPDKVKACPCDLPCEERPCSCCSEPGTPARANADSSEWVCDCSCHPQEAS